jgi:hypothetical protein
MIPFPSTQKEWCGERLDEAGGEVCWKKLLDLFDAVRSGAVEQRLVNLGFDEIVL